MILKIIRVNGGIPEKTNCYIIQDENTKETMVIDPGGNPEKVIEMNLQLFALANTILLTALHLMVKNMYLIKIFWLTPTSRTRYTQILK